MVGLIWAFALGCDVTLGDDFGVEDTIAVPSPTGATAATADTGPVTVTGDTGSTLPDLTCVDIWAAAQASQTVPGDTTGAVNERRPSCCNAPGLDGPEVLVGFTAPTAAIYRFNLVDTGTTFDTVLAVLGSCDGPELACDDDFEVVSFQSRVEVPLLAGQTVIAQVDGFTELAVGPFFLEIEAL